MSIQTTLSTLELTVQSNQNHMEIGTNGNLLDYAPEAAAFIICGYVSIKLYQFARDYVKAHPNITLFYRSRDPNDKIK